MEPKSRSEGMFFAPGAASSGPSYVFPGADKRVPPSVPPTVIPPSFPRLDDRLVPNEDSPYEMIRGEKVQALPANVEHADAQLRAAVGVDLFLRDEYVAAVEMLTRVNGGSDFATDVSVRKRGVDPATGERYLEELSFEIVNEQTLKSIESKAQDLVRRGVRRVFAVFVKKGQISEWSRTQQCFVPMDKDATFDDPVLVRPMVVRALVDRALALVELVRTLELQKHPEIQRIRKKGLDEGHKKGLDEGHKTGHKKGLDEGQKKGLDEGHKKGLDEGTTKVRSMFVRLLQVRFGEIPSAALARIARADADTLDAWADKVASASGIDDVLGPEQS